MALELELGVAIQLKNPQFTEGTYVEGQLSTTIAGSKALEFNRVQYPTALDAIQYQDSVMLGPSTNSAFKRNKEVRNARGVITVVGDGGDNKAAIFLDGEVTENAYSGSDSFTALGHGLAGGWNLGNPGDINGTYCTGIRQGIVNTKITRQFTWIDDLAYYNNGLEYCVTTEPLYLHKKLVLIWAKDLGEAYGLDYALAISNVETRGLITPKRQSTLFSEAWEAEFSIPSSENPTGPIYVLFSDYHMGGYNKPFAQRFNFNLYAFTPESHRYKIISQPLKDFGGVANFNRSKASLIPFQNYRMGARIYVLPRGADYGTDFRFQIGVALGPNNAELFSVDVLNGQNNTGRWYEVSKVVNINSEILDDYPEFVLLLDKYTSNTGKCVLYIDQVWLEHAGGVYGGQLNGCLKFNYFNVWPEQESFTISTDEQGKKTVKFKLSTVPEQFWFQLNYILEWQKRGHLLNLHTNLSEATQVITGKLKIDSVNKDFWHLDYRSFDVTFTEE